MLSEHQPLIVNAAADLAGAIAFAIFLTLALRGATIRQWRDNVLSIGSAALALLWNAGSFLVLLLPPVFSTHGGSGALFRAEPASSGVARSLSRAG